MKFEDLHEAPWENILGSLHEIGAKSLQKIVNSIGLYQLVTVEELLVCESGSF